MLWYVGDLHGNTRHLALVDLAAQKAGVTAVIQVGDFGILWEAGMRKYFDKRARQNRPGPTWYTCGGNHEQYERWLELPGTSMTELAPGCFWVHRGEVLTLDNKRHLFMGEAESTDKYARKEGVSWWPQEVPTRVEWEKFAEAYQTGVDVIVSHDAPLAVPLWRDHRENDGSVPWTFTRIQNLFKGSVREPAFWAFGHHHCVGSWHINGVHYVCCGWEGERVEVSETGEVVQCSKFLPYSPAGSGITRKAV
jgi:hypothetical protein